MLAAAEAWCLALGSNRPEDIAFVIAEIRTAWTAAEPRRIEMARGEQGVIPAAQHAIQQKKILPTKYATKHEETPIVTSGGDSLGVGIGVARNGEAKGAAVASQSRKRERMTVETALAPDVEAGTSLFWVQVWCGVFFSLFRSVPFRVFLFFLCWFGRTVLVCTI